MKTAASWVVLKKRIFLLNVALFYNFCKVLQIWHVFCLNIQADKFTVYAIANHFRTAMELHHFSFTEAGFLWYSM